MTSITRDQLFAVLDDFTGASTRSIEELKSLLDRIVFPLIEQDREATP